MHWYLRLLDMLSDKKWKFQCFQKSKNDLKTDNVCSSCFILQMQHVFQWWALLIDHTVWWKIHLLRNDGFLFYLPVSAFPFWIDISSSWLSFNQLLSHLPCWYSCLVGCLSVSYSLNLYNYCTLFPFPKKN